MKYPKPKLFKPSPEDQKGVALKLAKHFPSDKVLVTQSGDKVSGTRNSK